MARSVYIGRMLAEWDKSWIGIRIRDIIVALAY